MIGIVVISHGTFCEGLLDTMQMLIGDGYGVKAVPLFPGETVDVYRDKLRQTLKESDQGDGVMVLADIKAGTPYQSAAYLAREFKMALVSGMNLPMLLSVTLELTEEDTLETLVERATEKDSFCIEGMVCWKGERKQRAKLSVNKN